MNAPPFSTFVEQRIIATLEAVWPVVAQLGLSRAQVYALAERVASLPPAFVPRWSNVEAWPELRCEGLEHLEAATAGGRGVIVVPAHFGAYHWTMIALLHAGHSVSLLVDARNGEQFAADVRDRMLPMYFEQGKFHDRGYGVFDIIDSENPNSLWRLSKAVTAGRAVIMMIDGNSGIDGTINPKGAVRLEFLGRDIWVRPGIAALAQTTEAQIVPVATFDDLEHNVGTFVFHPPIPPTPEPGESRKATRERIMGRLFAWLEAQVRERSDEWEEWWLLPKWWTEAPTRPSFARPAPHTLHLPELVGVRLHVPNPSLWRVMSPEGPVLFDFATRTVAAARPELLELFECAEQGQKILSWIRERDDVEQAKALVLEAMAAQLIALVR